MWQNSLAHLETPELIELPLSTIQILETFKKFGLRMELKPDESEAYLLRNSKSTITAALTKNGDLYMEMTHTETGTKITADIMSNGQAFGELNILYTWINFSTYQAGFNDLVNFILENQAGPHRQKINWQYQYVAGVIAQNKKAWATLKLRKDGHIELTQGATGITERSDTPPNELSEKYILEDVAQGLPTQAKNTLEWMLKVMGPQTGNLLILKHEPLARPAI